MLVRNRVLEKKTRKTKNNLCVYARRAFSWVCKVNSVSSVCECVFGGCVPACVSVCGAYDCSNQPGGRACPSADSVSPVAWGSTRFLTQCTHTCMHSPVWQTIDNNVWALDHKSFKKKKIPRRSKWKFSPNGMGKWDNSCSSVYYSINRHNGLDRRVIFTICEANVISR